MQSLSVLEAEGGASSVEMSLEGVSITFDDEVRFRLHSSVPASPENGSFVNGHRMTLEAGELRIGSRSYGRVEAGQHAHVTTAGVLVDGESRGALP